MAKPRCLAEQAPSKHWAALEQLHCAVYGLGLAGQSMVRFLQQHKAHVWGIDDNPTHVPTDWQSRAGWDCYASEKIPPEVWQQLQVLCLSPGISPRRPLVQAALGAHIPIWSELALSGPFPVPTLGITGTNGKSTTTALLGHMFQHLGYSCFAGGNLGTPLLQAWQQDVAYVVLELSSYQLERPGSFVCDVSVVLNLSPDHLERYGTMEAYAAAKAQLVAATKPSGRTILNGDDSYVRAMAHRANGPVWWISTQQTSLPGTGLLLQGDQIVGQGELAHLAPISAHHPILLGRHNQENMLAALAALLACCPHLSLQAAQQAMASFQGLPHRLAKVAEIAGVMYINDSKATNDNAAATAVLAMKQPMVLLLGGLDKGAGYQAVIAALKQRQVRAVLLYGAAVPMLAASFAGTCYPVHVVDDLQQAVKQASQLAQMGDVVLLAPACASFDAFANYMERGDAFTRWVQALDREPCHQGLPAKPGLAHGP